MRFTKIEIKNIKDIRHGEIVFPQDGSTSCVGTPTSDLDDPLNNDSAFECKPEAHITGIYGPNGSGKSTFCRCISLFQRLATDQDPLLGFHGEETGTRIEFLAHLVSAHANSGYISYELTGPSDINGAPLRVKYEVTLAKTQNSTQLVSEKLQYSVEGDQRLRRPVTIGSGGNLEIPGFCDITLPAEPSGFHSRIFNRRTVEHVTKSHKGAPADVFIYVVNSLQSFASSKLLVLDSDLIEATENGRIALPVLQGNRMLMKQFSTRYERESVSGGQRWPQDSKIISHTAADIETARQELENTAPLLGQLIPGLIVKLNEVPEDSYFVTHPDDPEDTDFHFECQPNCSRDCWAVLNATRGDTCWELAEESRGTLKLVAVAPLLRAVCKDPHITVVIDELDAGIFEYLLGLLLELLQDEVQGQFIFTAHNLIPLESLKPSCIVLSTVNVDRRFMRSKNIKKSNNHRKVYLRALGLGGYEEPLCPELSEAYLRAALTL